MLAITGHTYHDMIGTHFPQEIDIIPLFKPDGGKIIRSIFKDKLREMA